MTATHAFRDLEHLGLGRGHRGQPRWRRGRDRAGRARRGRAGVLALPRRLRALHADSRHATAVADARRPGRYGPRRGRGQRRPRGPHRRRRRRGAGLRPQHRAAPGRRCPGPGRAGRARVATRCSCTATGSSCPRHVRLDLGATAKARAADLTARRAAETVGVGVLVELGGDIATAGPAPVDGWQVLVQDTPDDPACQVSLAAGWALATSSTVRRAWRRGGVALHHIVDPRTAAPARPVWRSATVTAPSCVEANTASTAAVVLGREAARWLAVRGLHRPPGRPSVNAPCGSASGRRWRHELPRPGTLGPRPRQRRVALAMLTLVAGARASPPDRDDRVPGLGRFGTSDLHRTAALTGTGLIAVHLGEPVLRSLCPAAHRRLRAAVPVVVPAALAGPGHARGGHPRRGDRRLAAASPGRARTFRLVHWATYALWPLALLHALGSGSDAGRGWFRASPCVCVVAVSSERSPGGSRRRTPGAAGADARGGGMSP